jgi:hypothetical protein
MRLKGLHPSQGDHWQRSNTAPQQHARHHPAAQQLARVTVFVANPCQSAQVVGKDKDKKRHGKASNARSQSQPGGKHEEVEMVNRHEDDGQEFQSEQ